jgi:hypothetical protein
LLEESCQYSQGKEFTPNENDRNESYFTQGACGAGFAGLRDVDGELITDADGFVIFTA